MCARVHVCCKSKGIKDFPVVAAGGRQQRLAVEDGDVTMQALVMLAYSLVVFQHHPGACFVQQFLVATHSCLHMAKPQVRSS